MNPFNSISESEAIRHRILDAAEAQLRAAVSLDELEKAAKDMMHLILRGFARR
jgi:hypothetical protein